MAEEPPSQIREFFEYVQETGLETLKTRAEYVDPQLFDFRNPKATEPLIISRRKISQLQDRYPEVQEVFFDYARRCSHCHGIGKHIHSVQGSGVFEVEGFPGLYIYENLFKANFHVQVDLVDQVLHKELASPSNETNLHQDYHIEYPETKEGVARPSYFDPTSSELEMLPRLSASWSSSPLEIRSFIEKLRWLKFGSSTAVPSRMKALFEGLFEFKVKSLEARISTSHEKQELRRDLSGSTVALNVGLGCDGIIIVGLPAELTTEQGVHNQSSPQVAYNVVAIRLQTTDTVVFTGASKKAWYGIAKVFPNTFPLFEDEWPCWSHNANNPGQQDWKGCMKGRRIDLVVR